VAHVVFNGVGKVYPDGTRAVDNLDLAIDPGEFMVLVGPSGCGKTTALRMVAGLEEISEGELLIDGQVMNLVEPRKRDVAMVFQNFALYPHMSVFQNIAFPLRSRKLPKKEIRQRVDRTAEMLGLTEQLRRRPRNLSGGQRQRVAMGRAIVREPRGFLMDEPLSNLDAKLRVQMRAEISRLQRDLGVTTLYVTHDQVEAMTMGTRIAIMRKGVLQQVGAPQELYDRPANLFVATFVGSPAMNLFRGRLDGSADEVECVIGEQRVVLPRTSPGLAAYLGRELAVGIRPEHFRSPREPAELELRLSGEVQLVETLGFERLVHLHAPGSPVVSDEVLEVAADIDASAVQALERDASTNTVSVVARLTAETRAEAGRTVDVAVDVSHLHFFDLETGAAVL
jgi:multiple sugar transport system ATP-binding protein